MSIENLIYNLRVERDINNYFENVGETIDAFFEEDEQEVIYTAVNTILEKEEFDLSTKIDIIEKLLEEAAAKSSQESRWSRPKEIAWNAREPNQVTWGKGVNAWFDTFPGKGKETR